MTLDELLNLLTRPNPPTLRTDSRQVQPGDIFVAIPGTNYDGHRFIPHALQNGAKYIVAQTDSHIPPNPNAQTVLVEDSTYAAALLAQAEKGYPAAKLTNLAVTGTNGKTTVAFMTRRCLQQAGHKCGLIGTVAYDTGNGRFIESNLTTPDPLTIAELTAQMVRNHAQFMITEASSHALQQNRLATIDFKAAAFTNLSGDHLDYHKTEQSYLNAKAKLFRSLSPHAVAVLNKQSPHAQHMASITNARILWYAVDAPADICAYIESTDTTSTDYTICHNDQCCRIRSPLLGRHNVENALAAAGLCLAAGIDLPTIAAGIASLQAVPGRLERISPPNAPTVIIDYAHTDDALKNVLAALRPLCKARLWVVFGCGGDRDRSKRPRMARIAEQLADTIVVTSDNPRTEDPHTIIEQILAGFSNPNAPSIHVEPDREKAIHYAVTTADPADLVLIAGKGHETYQIIGTRKLPFSDKQVALQALQNRQ